MWLTRFGHVDPFDTDRADWVSTLHRWFDHELMGVENGILDEPAVKAETGPNQWEQSRTWPISAARSMALTFQADGTMMLAKKDRATASYVNSPALSDANAVKLGDNANRLMFLTGTTGDEIRISGTPTVDLEMTHTAPVGQVSVLLVDYGQMDRVSVTGEGLRRWRRRRAGARRPRMMTRATSTSHAASTRPNCRSWRAAGPVSTVPATTTSPWTSPRTTSPFRLATSSGS